MLLAHKVTGKFWTLGRDLKILESAATHTRHNVKVVPFSYIVGLLNTSYFKSVNTKLVLTQGSSWLENFVGDKLFLPLYLQNLRKHPHKLTQIKYSL